MLRVHYFSKKSQKHQKYFHGSINTSAEVFGRIIINKQEFKNALCLRYGWKVPNTPFQCACGEKNSVDHTLNCKLGGYVNMRHNNIRDFEANLLTEVCKDVKVEPELLPIGDRGIGDFGSLSTSGLQMFSRENLHFPLAE